MDPVSSSSKKYLIKTKILLHINGGEYYIGDRIFLQFLKKVEGNVSTYFSTTESVMLEIKQYIIEHTSDNQFKEYNEALKDGKFSVKEFIFMGHKGEWSNSRDYTFLSTSVYFDAKEDIATFESIIVEIEINEDIILSGTTTTGKHKNEKRKKGFFF